MKPPAGSEEQEPAASTSPWCRPGNGRHDEIYLPGVRGHAGLVAAILSPDLRLLCVLGDSTMAAVIDLATWRVLFYFEHEGARPRCAGFSPDGRTLVTGDSEGAARFWATDTGVLARVLTAAVDPSASDFDGVSTIAWSQDGVALAIARADGLVWLCAGEGAPRLSWMPIAPWDQGARALLWSFDGLSVVASLASGDLVKIDAASGAVQPIGGALPRFPSRLAWQPNGLLSVLHDARDAFAVILPGEARPRWRVAVDGVSAESADGTLVLVSEGRSLRLRRADDGSVVSGRMLDEACAHSLAFGPGGEWIVGVSGGVLWIEGDTVRRIEHPDNVMFVAAAPGCPGAVLFAGEDGVIVRWCPGTQQQSPTRPTLEPLWSADVGGFVGTAQLSPDGTQLLTAGDSLVLWDVQNGRRRAVLVDQVTPSPEVQERVLQASWSPRGDRILVVDHTEKTASLWDPETARPVSKLEGTTFQARFVGDAVLVFTSEFHESRLKSGLSVADARTGALRGVIPPDSGQFDPLATTTNGSHIVLSRNRALDNLILLDLQTGKALSMAASPVRAAAFSPTGRLAAAHANGLWFWGLDGTSWRAPGAPPIGFDSVTWSPDGQRLAATTGDGGVFLFNVEGETVPLERPELRAGAAFSRAYFGPRGDLLAAMVKHGPPVMWRTFDGTLVGVLEGSRAPCPTLQFSPDGHHVATYASSSTSPLRDPVIRLFDERGAPAAALTGVEGHAFTDVVFSLDGAWILAAASGERRPEAWRDPRPRLWRTSDGAPAGPVEGGVGDPRFNVPLVDGWLTCCSAGKLRRWRTPEMP